MTDVSNSKRNYSLNQLRRFIALSIALAINTIAFAQPTGPGGPGPAGPAGPTGDQPCLDPQCIPVDGGLILLLIAGVLFGVTMILKFNKKTA